MKRSHSSLFSKPSNRAHVIRRKRWNPFALIIRIFKRAAMAVGAIVLFSLLLGIVLGMFVASSGKSMPKDMILVFNIESAITETELSTSLLDPFSKRSLTVHQVIAALEKAQNDKRVRGLVVSLDSAGLELAHIEELRKAVHNFRNTGKFAHIYTPSFADLGSGIGAYYFASAFDQIWMQPVGMLSMTGMQFEMPFARGALEKIGVTPQFERREDYKTAMENFTNESMSPQNREMLTSVLKDLSERMVSEISNDRKIDRAAVQRYVDLGLLGGEEALKARLITHLDYPDVLVDGLRDGKSEDDLPLVSIEDYHEAGDSRSAYRAGRKDIALVHVAGQIVPGSGPEPGYATSDYIAHALEDAAKDDLIEAIVVRVDSPGGSPTASETIRRAIVKAQEKGKKVIVSMGPTAASGGYWVSADADRIFASPSTLTGSIGVVMGKFELSGLWDKVGVKWEGPSWGENSNLWSANAPFNAAELERINAAIDETYQGFLLRVANGRDMKVEDVRKIARGRVWTGAQAVQNGLVDELGGLDTALDYAAREIGAKDRHAINVVPMPEPLTGMEQLMMMFGGEVSAGNMSGLLSLLQLAAPAAHELQAAQRMGPFTAYSRESSGLRN